MSEEIQPTTEVSSSRSRQWSTIFLWAALVGVLALLGWGLVNTTAARPEAGEAAPAFTMEFFDGYGWEERPAAEMGNLEGKVVVLNFWAAWCVECRVEADLLEASWRKYKDEGVVFLGIAYADVEPNSLAYLEEFNITYPNAPDLGTSISRKYEITGVPETFFIGKDGRIADVRIGPVNEAVLDGNIARLLAEGG